MRKKVIDLDREDCVKDLVQDMETDKIHERINQNAESRKDRAAQEAQRRLRAEKAAERCRNILIAQKRRGIKSLIFTAALSCIVAYAYAAWNVPEWFFLCSIVIASFYFGWCLNSTVRLFRRKSRGKGKG